MATRFFDRDNVYSKGLQPGFMLALVETRVLSQQLGIRLWDLGGTDGMHVSRSRVIRGLLGILGYI